MPESTNRADFLWAVCYSTFVAVMFLSGGISLPSDRMIYFHTGFSLALLTVALVRLQASGFPSRMAAALGVLCVLALALVLIQLIPLPPVIWQGLPERSIITENFKLLEQMPTAFPFTMSPENTRLDALALLPAVAAFFGCLTLKPKYFVMVGMAVLACAAVGTAFALLQFSRGDASPFYLYEPDQGIGVGTFNNRNFFAAQIYTSIIFLGMTVAQLYESRRDKLFMIGILALVFCGTMLSGLALSGSRSGILLTMLAIPIALILIQRSIANFSFLKSGMLTVGLTLGGLLIIAQSSMFGILRLANDGVVDKSRLAIFEPSFALLRNTLPYGTGFGTFVPIFQLHEAVTTIQPEIVNHAHNDWLEIAIEGGAPAMLLEIAALIAVTFIIVAAFFRGHGASASPFQRGAILVALMLMTHSLVDYPLRTPALAVIFSLCLALSTIPVGVLRSRAKRSKQDEFRPGKNGFVKSAPEKIH